MKESEISQWTSLIHRECGIDLGPSKAYLILSRLTPLLKEYRISNLNQLYNLAAVDSTGKVMGDIISALSTHETSFFRDVKVFEMIKSHCIPMLLEMHDCIRIWSAACSTGQEAYSLAMICEELSRSFGSRIAGIVGTDICAKSIETASGGCYSDFELTRGLTDERIKRFFKRQGSLNSVSDSLRNIVEFKVANLFESVPYSGKFDLILCRNVAIYFPKEKRVDLYSKLASKLSPGGILIIGSTESMLGLSHEFQLQVTKTCSYYVRV